MSLLSPESTSPKAAPRPAAEPARPRGSIPETSGDSSPPHGATKSDVLASAAFWIGVALVVLAILRVTNSF